MLMYNRRHTYVYKYTHLAGLPDPTLTQCKYVNCNPAICGLSNCGLENAMARNQRSARSEFPCANYQFCTNPWTLLLYSATPGLYSCISRVNVMCLLGYL
jgi:hypothetical protein